MPPTASSAEEIGVSPDLLGQPGPMFLKHTHVHVCTAAITLALVAAHPDQAFPEIRKKIPTAENQTTQETHLVLDLL